MWTSYCLSVGLKGGNGKEKALSNFISLYFSVYYHASFSLLFPQLFFPSFVTSFSLLVLLHLFFLLAFIRSHEPSISSFCFCPSTDLSSFSLILNTAYFCLLGIYEFQNQTGQGTHHQHKGNIT